MLKSAYSGGVPAIVPSESRELVVHEFPEPGASNNFKQEPPIEIVIDSKDIREKILQYLLPFEFPKPRESPVPGQGHRLWMPEIRQPRWFSDR